MKTHSINVSHSRYANTIGNNKTNNPHTALDYSNLKVTFVVLITSMYTEQHDSNINIQTVYTLTIHTDVMRIVVTK